MFDQSIRIDVSAQSCPPCIADAVQLDSALLNNAINACDAMPDGGRPSFRAKGCAALPDSVQVEDPSAVAPQASFGAISVRDSGGGMPDEVKERAFEPFFTTKEAGRGTGLGLSTVFGFVKQSDGAVTIDSLLGEGTTVTLYIPGAVVSAWNARGPSETGDAMAPGPRVLLVDDDADVRAVDCADGEQALLALVSDPPFDLLLTDIALGSGMRGTELAALAQARRPSLRVLLISGYSAELLEADRTAPQGWELLRKPCTRGELAQAIARVVDG